MKISEEIGIPQEFPYGIWFRGHSSSTYKLEPTVFREKEERFRKNNEELFDETNIFISSKLRLPHHRKVYSSEFDWLCFMQHYNTPTRLLDWSESILVALYFAVKDSINKKMEKDAEIVVLNARALNYAVFSVGYICLPEDLDVVIRAKMAEQRSKIELESVFSRAIFTSNINFRGTTYEQYARGNEYQKYLPIGKFYDRGKYNYSVKYNLLNQLAKPIAVFPYRWNERMVFQSSVFTLHGGKNCNKEEPTGDHFKLPEPISLEEINQKKQILKYYKIPKENKDDIEKTLFKLGIHEGSLFPEMDHQSIYLKQQW